MKIAVIVFPGSNCDRDAYGTLQSVADATHNARSADRDNHEPAKRRSMEFAGAHSGSNIIKIWHGDASLPKVDLVVVPGGFSYGDYLRSGAMAAHSPIMGEVVKHAQRGGLVMGICNGFQILTEANLLPGVLLRNAKLKFLCREVFLRVENTQTVFTKNYQQGQVITVPIAHHDGNYFADNATLQSLEDNRQIAFRYCTAKGALTEDSNPNGSRHAIAGIFNQEKNVLGMMPHPERHSEMLLGGTDGRALFESLLVAA